MEINKSNIRSYLLSKTDLLNDRDSVEITELNKDTDPYADGYINFIFRVRQGERSFIVKQSRPYVLVSAITPFLPADRNYLEYISYRLRDEIVKNYVPKIYFVDEENSVFVMQDLGKMKLMRFELSHGRKFPFFPEQIGDFIAKSHFYTSEIFLSKQVFCDMYKKFVNVDMRCIMEDKVLLRCDFGIDLDESNPLAQISEKTWTDPQIRLELMRIRDVFMKQGECLIHGDLHTSNIFIDASQIRVIDMEYSFTGPFGYDLGYLLANFISQFAAFTFNSKFSPDKRESFQHYLLDTIEAVFNAYFQKFRECFEKDAKDIYKMTEGYLDRLFVDILNDALGFIASTNMFRIINLASFPDIDCIANEKLKLLANGLSLAIDEFLLKNRHRITSPEMIKENIFRVQKDYLDRFSQ